MPARRTALLIALAAAALLPYLVNLGATSIIDANEAFYTETPREMIEAGTSIDSTFNYEPRFNKPPLSYWVVAASYRVFGVSLFAARLPIVAGAFVILATAYLLGRISGSARAGLVAAVTLAATPRFLLFSRRIIIDIYTAMFLGLTLLFFALAETQPARRRVWLVAMYAAAGLGVLTKGPVAIALPAMVLVAYIIATGQISTLARMMIPAGILIIAAIVVPYYAALYSLHGWDYISAFVFQENLARYSEGAGVGPQGRGLLFYLPVLFTDLYFPWSLLLPAGLALVPWRRAWRNTRTSATAAHVPADETTTTDRIRVLLGLWIVVIVAFFSLSRAKQDLYILPCVAAAAALVGILTDKAIGGALSSRLAGVTRWSIGALSIVMLILGGAVVIVAGIAGGRFYVVGAVPTGVVLAVSSALALLFLLVRRRPAWSLGAVVAGVVIGHWILVLWTLPDFERYKPVPHLASAIQPVAGPASRIGMYRVATPSLVFYLRRHVDQMFEASQLTPFFSGTPDAFCVMREEEYLDVKASIGVPTRILAGAPRFDARLVDFIGTGELPKLVVVTNRLQP